MRIGGKEREIKFGVNALRTLLVTRNQSPDEIIANGADIRDIELGVTLVWAGLLHEDRTLTLDQVGDWLDEEEGLYFQAAQAAAVAFMAAFKRSFGLSSKEPDEQETPPKN